MTEGYQYGHPFRLVVPPEAIHAALSGCSPTGFRRRVFDPETTLWTWMAQTASQDRSCRHAVSRVAAFHAAQRRSVSTATGAYTQARQRLEGGILATLARGLARDLETNWQLESPLGRPLFAVDGSTLSAPDTESNQQVFPQHSEMKPGVGFPVIRTVFLVSLTTGAIMDFSLAPYHGQGTGEASLFRGMFGSLRSGDVVVGDRAYESYWHRHLLRATGVDTVFRLNASLEIARHPRLATLGRGDWLINQQRPAVTPQWVTRAGAFPTQSAVRLTSIRLGEGRQLHVASTLDASDASREMLLDIYAQRWGIEGDIRSAKIDLGMDILRCKTAGMLEKEAWATVLTYNAVRALMASAAERKGISPREVSFKGALQLIGAFGPQMDLARQADRQALFAEMLERIGSHIVGNRPDRAEPRLVKRRRKAATLMTIPRDEARAKLRNGRYR